MSGNGLVLTQLNLRVIFQDVTMEDASEDDLHTWRGKPCACFWSLQTDGLSKS